jgi:hypothetical protein
MAGPYKALTHVHLPVIEKDYKPGEEIPDADLEEAGQTGEDIQALIDGGAVGGMDDDINPQNIIPDPSMPTIAQVVADAQAVVQELTARGEEVPSEVQAVANLDYTPVSAGDVAKAGDTNA